jgi:hypothetical protein
MGSTTVDSCGKYEHVDSGSSGDESGSRRDSISISELGFDSVPLLQIFFVAVGLWARARS